MSGKPFFLKSAKPVYAETAKRIPMSLIEDLYREVDRDVSDLLGHQGALSTAAGMFFRPQQLALANAMAQNMKRGRHGLNQAGTGTGKSNAYSIAAILHALKTGEKVVIATSNKLLQDRLVNHDFPYLAKTLDAYWRGKFGRTFKFAQLLGFGNYVCREKLGERQLDGVQQGSEAVANAWAHQTDTGLLHECDLNLTAPNFRPLRQALTTTSQDCLGKKCPSRERCFYYNAKDKLDGVDIIVVNHALLAGNFRASGAILPAAGVYIVDEAHRWPDALREGYHMIVGRGELRRIMRRYQFCFLKEDWSAICKLAKAFFDQLGIEVACHQKKPRLYRSLFSEGLKTHCDRLLAAIKPASESLLEQEDYRAQAAGNQLNVVARILEAMWGENVVLRTHQSDEDGVGLSVTLVDLTRISCHLLRQGCWQFVSATLTTTKNAGTRFEYVRRTLGLPGTIVAEVDVGSPFDYGKQQLYYVTRTPYPGDGNRRYNHRENFSRDFAKAMRDEYLELLRVTNGHALLLFSSYDQLHAMRSALGKLPWPVRAQSREDNEHEMIEWFRNTPNAVLLSASLWEGIDVPGPQLSLVVCDKLPLLPPDDPVFEELRIQYAREYAQEHCVEFTQSLVNRRGLKDISIPRATWQLGQGVGRLIRGMGDRGLAAVMDSRLLTKMDFSRVLEMLPGSPSAQRVLSREDLPMAVRFIHWRKQAS